MNKEFVQELPEPRLSKLFFADTRFALVWLVVRLYAGFIWLMAGWEKFESPAWIGSKAGAAIHGFVLGALKKTAGDHPDVQGWYAGFLGFVDQHAILFSYIITYGELMVGIALVLGIFTGIAAFFGSFMNMNFLLAGTVSINPILAMLQLLLILAWRVAGWIGLDRWALPALGTPWKAGKFFNK